ASGWGSGLKGHRRRAALDAVGDLLDNARMGRLRLRNFVIVFAASAFAWTTADARAAADARAEPSRAQLSSRRGAIGIGHRLARLARGELTDVKLLDRAWRESDVRDALEELGGLPIERPHTVRMWRAFIYARRGRVFKSALWQAFAVALPGYQADESYTDAKLTAQDRQNLALLRHTELRLDPTSAPWSPDPESAASPDAFPACPRDARLEVARDEARLTTYRCVTGRRGAPVPHGPTWRWFPTGRLASQETYVHGRREGFFVSWFENGL